MFKIFKFLYKIIKIQILIVKNYLINQIIYLIKFFKLILDRNFIKLIDQLRRHRKNR